MKKLIVCGIFIFATVSLFCQKETSPILFIYDASGSMWGQLDGKTKKEIASNVLSDVINKLPENQRIGLIAYGHRKKGDCNDIENLVSLSNTSKISISNAVKEINPLGKTPLSRSAQMAIKALEVSQEKATIILVTDGIESCDGDLCEVISDAKSKGIDFKLHIVGFGIKDEEKEALICATNAGGGNYYDAQNTTGLAEGLEEATNQTVDKSKGNFSIYAIKNNAPVDVLVKAFDKTSEKVVDGDRSYRDTAFLNLPKGSYHIQIQPLENTDLKATTIEINLTEDEIAHRDISFDSGILAVNILNNEEGWDATVKVFNAASRELIAGGRTYGRLLELEVNPGKYYIEIQALRINGLETKHVFNNVEVHPNKTELIDYAFKSGIAKIGVKTAAGELVDATVSISEAQSGKSIGGGRTYTSASSNPKEFLINPGVYNVKIVSLGKHKGNSETFEIRIEPNKTFEKIISF